jgi:hypothetical protein
MTNEFGSVVSEVVIRPFKPKDVSKSFRTHKNLRSAASR